MQEVHFIDDAKDATELLKPIRIEILSRLAQPKTCPDLAKELGATTQKINYHMNVLREAGLVEVMEERRKRGTVESVYQAVARSYWFSPRLVTAPGGESMTSDQASLAYLLRLTEELQIEIGKLAEASSNRSIPTLAMDCRIELPDSADRESFYVELQDMVKQLARKYGQRGEQRSTKRSRYRFAIVCYPDNVNEK